MDLAKIRKKAKRSQPAEAEAGPSPAKAPAVPKPKAPKAEPPPPPAAETAPEPPPIPAGDAEALFASASSDSRKDEEPAEEAREKKPSSGQKLLIFQVGRERYAIPIHEIAIVIEEPAITRIPNSPPYLAGILSLRGKIVSVVDARVRLGVPARGTGDLPRKVIVIESTGDRFGLMVDAIDQLIEVNLQALEPPPEGFKPSAQEYVEGVFHHRNHAVGFLNLPLLLTFDLT